MWSLWTPPPHKIAGPDSSAFPKGAELGRGCADPVPSWVLKAPRRVSATEGDVRSQHRLPSKQLAGVGIAGPPVHTERYAVGGGWNARATGGGGGRPSRRAGGQSRAYPTPARWSRSGPGARPWLSGNRDFSGGGGGSEAKKIIVYLKLTPVLGPFDKSHFFS